MLGIVPTRVRSSLILGGLTKKSRLKFSQLVGAIFVCAISLLSGTAVLSYRTLITPSVPALELNFVEQKENDLPKWITDYIDWHAQVRKEFPGAELFQNPNAPPILVRTCLGLCGGLNDRLGQLPWDLYLANQTRRILLLHWHRPVHLENFLVPNRIDWTVPRDIEGFFSNKVRVSRNEMKKVRDIPELFHGYASEQPEADFWESHLDESIQRAVIGDFKDKKVLRHRLLGHINEEELERRLRLLGETDTIHWTSSFGKLFHAFFKLSDPLQKELVSIYNDLNLQPGHYSAAHCRVRHPKATPQDVLVKGKFEDHPADKTGLPWQGKTREFAIQTASKALKCLGQRLKTSDEKVYFYSDSNDLVQYVAHDLSDGKYLASHQDEIALSTFESEALGLAQKFRLVARNVTLENAHIDRQKGRDPPAYFATFLDLFLAINARCVSFGIGNYALFATKISGTRCKILYQEEFWGGLGSKRANADVCSLA